ncbi:fatty acid desaturase [Paenisporosarcina sp. OV554]|uniref:fatty acid desaturase n=1 Tax=Paenisporosarcina sp. OV554 TaxID=2135694 RepID=UPI000D3A9957|nr:fatty acid desaturase [Paenisporosarcina sp. OV554]PUB16668.1 omega-6 fatty acid desaturase (delta-12 desaturase) [Paenisporosarcina sp. OV554]
MSKEKTMQLRKLVAPFEKSDMSSSVKQIINTIPPFFILWFLAYLSLDVSIFLTLALAIAASGFIVRTFIIFHDCTHGSFFKSKKANSVLGTITGILTLFAYEKWKRDHSIHHATSSNLDKRGVGDVWVMTVDEYIDATPGRRFAYRLYRNPIVMFGLGPLFLYFVSNRFNRKDARPKERNNTYFINVALVALYAFMIWLVGIEAFAIIQGTILIVAGSFGIWLFYVQHQFEDSYFEDEEQWDYVKAAVDGSSFYKLPKVLQWLTGNIGYHHVHHLSPRVPNYRLEQAHDSTPPLHKATTITLKTSLKSFHFRLYDESKKTFVSFKEIKHLLQNTKNSIQLQTKRSSMEGK